MKIKKVEISEFRAFSTKTTFDFTLNGGIPANFVSIYAPNGFGKTSFYDAVEWAVTNSIDRFFRNYVENDKYSKIERKADKSKLFLTNHSSNGKNAFVNVETNSKKYYRKVPTTVYDFKNRGENLFFKDSILSQDTIDAFLKEENPENRYQKFVDSFVELKGLDNAYNNITKLISINEGKLDDIKKQITQLTGKQLLISFQDDDKILKDINSLIIELRTKNEIIDIIQEGNSETDLNIFSSKLKSKIEDYELEIMALNLRIENLNFALKGHETEPTLIGIISYFNLRENKANLQKRREEFKKIGESLSSKIRTEEKIRKLNSETTILSGLLNEYNSVISLFDKYIDIRKKIEQIQNDNKTIIDSAEKLTDEIDEDKKTSNRCITEIESINKQLLSAREKLEKLPVQTVRLNDEKLKESQLKKELSDTELLVNSSRKELDEFSVYVSHLEGYNVKIQSNIKEIVSEAFFINDIVTIQKIVNEEEKVKTLLNEQKLNEEEINLLKNFSDDLKIFISKGLEIINSKESSICPLCNHDYISYANLIDKVENNIFVDKAFQKILSRKSELDIQIKDCVKTINDMKLELTNKVSNKANSEKREQEKLNQAYNKILDKRESLKLQIGNLENDILLDLQFFDGLVSGDLRIKLESDVEKLSLLLKEKNQLLSSINDTIESKQIHYRNSINETKENEIIIVNLTNNIDFKSVMSFLEKERLNEVTDLPTLLARCDKIRLSMLEYSKETGSLNNQLKIFDDELLGKPKTIEEVNAQIELLIKSSELIDKTIFSFEQFISSDYNILLSDLDLEKAQNRFEEEIIKVKNRREEKIKIELLYKKINSLKDDVFTFLQGNKTKQEIRELNSRKSLLTQVDKSLKTEKNGLIEFLSEKIKTFFYTDLINQIYFKIEPHPEYEQIEFECSFAMDKPRLEIWVVDRKKKKSIPTLYFSTAQINILSLSVFLARALNCGDNGEPVNCIFIDDPIQSMDSINILSFIDLFRSLVVNFDKQIIISTHEENFHKLLQKKMPTKNSKFLELETFGKVKS